MAYVLRAMTLILPFRSRSKAPVAGTQTISIPQCKPHALLDPCDVLEPYDPCHCRRQSSCLSTGYQKLINVWSLVQNRPAWSIIATRTTRDYGLRTYPLIADVLAELSPVASYCTEFIMKLSSFHFHQTLLSLFPHLFCCFQFQPFRLSNAVCKFPVSARQQRIWLTRQKFLIPS